ncbi:MAG: T9SS type A sorting domain-containing protein [candidate division WOR-3 bacterium]
MKTKCILLILFTFFNLLGKKMPLVYDIENTGMDCPLPDFLSFSELPTIKTLPDPFIWADSNKGRIKSCDDWRCRRAEISALIQHYELGTKPEPPTNLKASFSDTIVKLPPIFEGGDSITLSGKILAITIVENEDTFRLYAPISLPEGEGPFPAVIGVGWSPTGSLPSDLFITRGIATIHYMDWQVANAWSNKRGDGAFFKLYPDPKRGKFIAFAWGVSRIIDGLEMCPQAKIDLSHLAVTGCSYAGKIALFSGAFDERIALTIAQEPGGGGDAAWRVTETLPGNRETLKNAQGFAWYSQDLSQFNYAVTKLPFDHHEVMALVAPRALLIIGNPDMEWLAEESGHVACKAAHEVWKALGVPDRFGFSKVGHSDHCVLPDIQRPEVIAFIEKFLLGDTTINTNVEISPYNPDLSKWITWETPKLKEPLSFTGDFYLDQNHPNPFNSITTIEYYLKEEANVEISIYDIMGKKITTVLNKRQCAGKQTLIFNGSDLPSGIYIYTLKVGKTLKSKKMVLLR